MKLLPAIDLMGGKVVRLRQGRADAVTVYSDDPVAFARRWEAEGGDWLHLVDLDAAFTGSQANLESVRAIARAVKIPCELGGGMRDLAAVERALQAGVERVVIGTRAAEAAGFVGEVATRFGSPRVAVGIDAKDGMVAVRGWTETSTIRAVDLARRVEAVGAGAIIYTDIATDGMLTGPNYGGLREMLGQVRVPLVASGGVSSVEDLLQLAGIEGLWGAIIGRALYEGKADLAEARRRLDGSRQ